MLLFSCRQRVKEIHDQLGIPSDYEERFGLPFQHEAEYLVDAGNDMFGRSQQMAPTAHKRWVEMRNGALDDDVQLLLVSAFRSVDYQTAIIEKKLAQGQTIELILQASAAPGFSEHHTGRAIDLTTVDCPPLLECFEETQAYRWLCVNAKRYGFIMSYPKSSHNKIIYEPWHWMLKD